MPKRSAASTCFRPRPFMSVSILKTSCALTKCSPAFGTPRSLNTFRPPFSYPFLLMVFSPLQSVRLTQPLLHQFQVPGGLASSFRFLLESVKDVHRSGIAQGVHGAKRIATKVLYHFHHPCPAEAAEGLRIAMLAAALRDVEGITHVILDRPGKPTQVPAARSDPDHRFQGQIRSHLRLLRI